MSKEFTLEIKGKEFELPKEVFDLIHSISMERDQYKSIIRSMSPDGQLKPESIGTTYEDLIVKIEKNEIIIKIVNLYKQRILYQTHIGLHRDFKLKSLIIGGFQFFYFDPSDY